MIRVFVDSGSSIKEHEKKALGVEIMPLKITLDGKEYTDGIDLDFDTFYHALIEKKLFPKTSLPSIGEADEKIQKYLADGDEVIILTISSGISGTYNAFKTYYGNEPRISVIDTLTAVGGVRILVEEINKCRNLPLAEIEVRVRALIPRIKIVAIPETLDYLQRGGRLSRTAWLFGSILQLKPLITIKNDDGHVAVLGKERGKRRAMQALVSALDTYGCDVNYPIVPSYTYDEKNLDILISITDEKYRAVMTEYDNLDPAIACHWGPCAFGYIFVGK